MSNVFNFILKGEEGGDENGDGKKVESSAQETNTTSVPLSRDEMRAKRLGKLVDPALLTENEEGSGAESAKKVDSTAKEVAGAAKIDYVSPVSLKKASEKDRGNFVGQKIFSDPALSAVESSEKTKSPVTSPSVGSANTPDKNARILNNALESVFLFSLRPPSAASSSATEMSGQLIKYMGKEGENCEGVKMLNGNNLTEALLERLADTVDGAGSSVNYLVGSYKRILQKESTLNADIRKEFFGCKAQCINFIVTALTEPETFSPNSDNSLIDLICLLKDDTSPHILRMLKDLADELTNQDTLQHFTSNAVRNCYEAMDVVSGDPPDMLALMMGGRVPSPMHSILSTANYSFGEVVRTLSGADKRFAKAVAEDSLFLLENSLVKAEIAPHSNQMSNLFNFAQQQQQMVVQGAALANTTLLGRMLRCVVDARDPQFRQMFESAHIGVPRSVLEGNFARLRSNLNSAQEAAADTLLSMLKAGDAKTSALEWLKQSIVCNEENEKDQPDPRVGASRGFLLQLSGVLLRLCKPFLHDLQKIAKIDWRYLAQPESEDVFSRQATGLFSQKVLSGNCPQTHSPPGTNAFMTQALFLSARALHLSFAGLIRSFRNLSRSVRYHRTELQENDPRAVHLFMEYMAMQTELLNPDMLSMTIGYCGALATLILSALLLSEDNKEENSRETILGLSEITSNQKEVLDAIPEYLVADMFELVNFAAEMRPDLLDGSPFLDKILELIIFFLRRPAAILSPHLRASLGLTLFSAFLPGSARDSWERQGNYKDGQQCLLLDSSPKAQKYLSPTLLLLYGDVERTGHYEKIDHRRKLGIVLKYLWSLPSHRAAFRNIANASDRTDFLDVSDAMDVDHLDADFVVGTNSTEEVPSDRIGDSVEEKNYFIRFANGIMNETNAQVNEALSNLAEIKNIQTLKASAEWTNMREEQRKQHDEKLEEAEQHARMAAGLCMDTIHMVNFLTSDEAVVKGFLKPGMLPRFTSMLLNVVNKLTGKKSLELKVENMEEYNFSPKDMLREICQTILHVCAFDAFCEAVVKDGFFNDGTPLDNAIKVVSKHSLVSPLDLKVLRDFREKVSVAAVGALEMDAIGDTAPDAYMDPLLLVLMSDPVLLKTSNNIVDRSTIVQQMLNDPHDPFNRAPITHDDIEPQSELKAEIETWLQNEKAKLAASKRIVP